MRACTLNQVWMISQVVGTYVESMGVTCEKIKRERKIRMEWDKKE